MVRVRLYSIFLIALFAMGRCSSVRAQSPPAHSTITIHVGKAGLFSGFGHEHTIIAPVTRGSVDQKAMSVEIIVAAAQLRVTDPDASEKDRAEIQKTMLGSKVLDAEKFPEIHFKSSHVQQSSPQHYRVTGTLDLHGVRKELTFDVAAKEERYQGKTRLKQSDFGIQPVTVGGGAVKVKDELELDFNISPNDLT